MANPLIDPISDQPKAPMLVLSTLDDYGLDPYEFRVYGHVIRRTSGRFDGECYERVSKMAATCKMSIRRAQYALRFLCEAGLLTQENRKGGTNIYRLNPLENWVKSADSDLEAIRKEVKNPKSQQNDQA